MEKISLNELKNRHAVVFNEVAEEMRQLYNQLIAELSKGHDKSIDWWASEVASRNPYSTPLRDDCCDFVFMQRIASQLKGVEVVVSKASLRKAMAQYCKKNNIEMQLSSNVTFMDKVKFIVWPFLRYCKLLFIYASYWFSANIVARRKSKVISNSCILINTFVHDDSFEKKGGPYLDRYYKRFGDLLTEREQGLLYYVPTLLNSSMSSISVMRAVRACPQQFLLKEDFLSILDYLYAFFFPFRAIRFLFKKAYLNGVDITSLVRHSFWYTIISRGSIESLLKYRFIKRLKEKKIAVRLAVEWFENQNIQKVSVVGFHYYYPKTEVIGYQGYIVSKDYISMFPVPDEYKSNLLPQTIAVVGKALLNGPKEFCNSFNVILAPALRFMDVYNVKVEHQKDDNFTILIPFPAEIENINALLQHLVVLQNLNMSNVRTIVKLHPMIDSKTTEMIKNTLAKTNNLVFLTKRSFIDLVDQADVVIGNQSSTSMESLARAVPVIIINQQGFESPIPSSVSTIIWRECNSSEEVKKALHYFDETKYLNATEYKKIAHEIKANYFEPVTREGVCKFLKFVGSDLRNEA